MITREELLKRRKEVKEKIEENKNEIKSLNANYKCARVYEGFGPVPTLGKKALVGALVHLTKKSDMEAINAAATELGFDDLKKENILVLGYTVDEWKNDFKTRAAVIKLEEENEKLNKAFDILSRNMTEEDKFCLDMESVEQLIS